MKHLLAVATSSAALIMAAPAHAQLVGDLRRGQYGLASGTQAPEGLVLTGFAYDYYTTTLVNPDGSTAFWTGSLNELVIPGVNLWYVSPLKILGANYGAQLSMWGTSPHAEGAGLSVNQTTYGFGDTYLKPVELGWHTTYVDVIAGFAVWIPTGRYKLGASNNTGQGQWGYEFSAGATLWFDRGHHFNLSTQAFYDIYSPKKGGPFGASQTQIQTGNIFTLEGGLGYRFLGGAANVGIPYFVQWKVTDDTLPPDYYYLLPVPLGKDWSMGLGVEVDVFWCETDGITLRFVQGFAGANTTNGSSYFIFYNHIFYFGAK
jgi:hypothetical protein